VAEKYALLVGINDYQNDIGALKYCVADVQAFQQALIQTAGYKPENVHLMTDQMSGQDLPHFINVILRLETLASRVQAQDTFIFYFSGHGISSQDQSYLLALDSNTATPRTLKRSAIPLQDVNEILSEVKAQQLLTIIDACRNNPESSRSNQDNLLSDDFARGFKIQPRAGPSGRPAVSATLYACSVGERAYEWAEKKQGVFSYFLLQGLNGQAANASGDITITDLADYTQQKVADWAQTYRGKQQTPWLSLQGGAKLVLVEALDPSRIYRLDLASQPSGFEVWINDQSIGSQTPQLISRPAGTYRILLQKTGYQDFRRTVILSSEQPIVTLTARPSQIRADVELGTGILFIKVFDEKEKETTAEITLNGKSVGQSPYTNVSILEGDHQVVISKDLYHQQVEDLTIAKDQKTSRTVILKPAFGGLRIKTDPAATSIILRDGDNVRVGSGTTPYYNPKLASGNYRLDLSRNRYHNQTNRQIQIRDGQTTSHSFELKPKFGTLVINSQPSGSKVLIAGQDRGQTPLKLEQMDSAQYLIEVEQSLYLTYTKTVAVRDGETTELEADLVSNFGTLDFSQVSPAGAAISINGKGYGRSPKQVDLDPGSYQVELSKTGYESQEIGGVLVVRGQTEVIRDQLVQMVGKLKILSHPAEAEIQLNGKSYGTTPNIVSNLPVGDYQLQLSKEGYQSYQQRVTVEQKTMEINHQLQEQPKFETIGMVLIPAGPSTSAFYMDKYEVTNAQYRKFIRAIGHRKPEFWHDSRFNQPNQPVVGVSWHDAAAYAKWAGKRLPTEAKWEYAARGGFMDKEFGWVDDESLARDYANYKLTGGKDKWLDTTSPVGSLKSNGYGLYDMAGNVWEWCQDWHDNDQKEKVLRGGSWGSNGHYLRLAYRGIAPHTRNSYYGFRCVLRGLNLGFMPFVPRTDTSH